VIKSFADKETRRIFKLEASKRLPWEIQERALDRLVVLNAATSLLDLNYPAYRLKKLSGDRAGQHSLRINQQWRVCFGWKGGNAYDVEIVDYH